MSTTGTNPLPAELEASLLELKQGARIQRNLTDAVKNKALETIASQLENQQAQILAANEQDLNSLSSETTSAFRDRLTLNPRRIAAMAESLRAVAALPDPNNEVVEERTLENGLLIRRVRAPLGCLFMIFESRPNVILEAFSLAFKSGNVILLRGGSDSKATAAVIYKMMSESLAQCGLSHACFVGLQDYDRTLVDVLLTRKDLIDVVVPRGGDRLIEYVQKTSHMPIIKNDRGLCHVYVDDEADLEMAALITANAKVQRPGVCNSLETVLIHRKIGPEFLQRLYSATAAHSLRWRADAEVLRILHSLKDADRTKFALAKESDWDTEHLDLILNARMVSGLDDALSHIDQHGSKHSESIITKNETKARRFQNEVDAAAVYWNASTRFTDGFTLGLGGELGISTQKLHVRGPVGLRELTTPRWVIDGQGQVRT